MERIPTSSWCHWQLIRWINIKMKLKILIGRSWMKILRTISYVVTSESSNVIFNVTDLFHSLLIPVGGFRKADSDRKSTWRNPHLTSLETTSSKTQSTKSTKISSQIFPWITWTWLNFTEKYMSPFYENPSSKFVEFDVFYFLNIFSSGYFLNISYFSGTRNTTHQISTWILETTRKETSPT